MHQHTNQIRKFIETNVFFSLCSFSSVCSPVFFPLVFFSRIMSIFDLLNSNSWEKYRRQRLSVDRVFFLSRWTAYSVKERNAKRKFYLIRCSRILRCSNNDSLYRLSHWYVEIRSEISERKHYAGRYKLCQNAFRDQMWQIVVLQWIQTLRAYSIVCVCVSFAYIANNIFYFFSLLSIFNGHE